MSLNPRHLQLQLVPAGLALDQAVLLSLFLTAGAVPVPKTLFPPPDSALEIIFHVTLDSPPRPLLSEPPGMPGIGASLLLPTPDWLSLCAAPLPTVPALPPGLPWWTVDSAPRTLSGPQPCLCFRAPHHRGRPDSLHRDPNGARGPRVPQRRGAGPHCVLEQGGHPARCPGPWLPGVTIW